MANESTWLAHGGMKEKQIMGVTLAFWCQSGRSGETDGANWSQHTNGFTASRLQTCCSFKVRRWHWKIYTWTQILTFSFPVTETDWLDPNTQTSSTAPIAAWLLSSGRAFGTPTCAVGEIEMIIGRALYWHDATSSWTLPFTSFNAHILPSVSISLPTF